MLRNHLLSLLILCFCGTLGAQVTVSGILLDDITKQPMAGVRVSTDLPDETVSDASGAFTVRHASGNLITLRFDLNGQTSEYQATIENVTTLETGYIVLDLKAPVAQYQDLPTISLDDSDDQSDASISGLLQSGDDLFARITDYTFSPARFRRRGLEAEYTDGYLNNLPINDLETGRIYWNEWGGLNEVMRQDKDVVGAEMADWGFGGISSTFNTDLRAASQWKQTKLSYSVTNRNYRNRIMGTWSTGLLPSGWAVSISGSRRWAQEGFIEGTFYDAWSYFLSVEKRFNDRHALNLVVMGAPYQRGGGSTSIQEMYDLADDNYYNSYWGYQEGKKRSARVYSGHLPIAMLRHDFHVNDKLTLTTALGYQTGKSTLSTLDWLNANDPRPDYYRRLPSYVDDPELAAEMTQLFTENQDLLQVQWGKLYEVNYNSDFTVEDADGIEGNTVTGALSRYIMEDRITDISKASGNILLQYQVSEGGQINAGASVIIQDSRIYKEVNDLMGGEFYLDWDKFAEQDFPGNEDALQNDLRRPNRILHEGDQFGWDYIAKIRQQSIWASYSLNTDKWEFSLAGTLKNQTYWRDGQTQNGKFPDNSYGESAKNNFLLPSGKGLIRYKLDGRNYITVSGMLSEMAPTFRNAYVSARTRDNVVDGLEKETLNLLELRYDLKAPDFKLSVAGFYINSKNGIESTNFYHDDLRTFVNFSLTEINREHTGIEAAFEYKLLPTLSLQGAAVIGQYIYTSRPNATVTQDNDGEVLLEDITVYAQNLYVSGTPQSAYTAGLIYKSKKFWSLFLNVNRFQESWINFNPLRRTAAAVELVEYQSEQWNEILQQEKVDPAWTVDISFYKSWMVNWPKSRTIFGLNVGVTNLLNNQDYVNGGYEQYRYDYENKDVSTFPTRYSYMQGLNFFLQGSMRFF
jgi:hypothetical protein